MEEIRICVSEITMVAFSRTIPAGKKDSIVERAPISGTINQLLYNFPKHSEGLLELRFYTNNSSVPNNTSLALEGPTTFMLWPEIEVQIGEKLTLEVNNRSKRALKPTVVAGINSEGY